MSVSRTADRAPLVPAEVGPNVPGDLRSSASCEVIGYVERVLRVRLDRGTLVTKRRTIGARTEAGRWVRVEARPLERVVSQGWGGIEASAALSGIAKPAWYRSMSWRDATGQVWWRADETEFVAGASSVRAGGTIQADPGLSERWWATLRASLAALAAHRTDRVAKMDTATATPDYLRALVEQAVADAGRAQVDTTIDEWTTAHADMTWANLTAPDCWILDWEDWGTAPRGFDAATLLVGSLAVPNLAERVRREFADDLASRSGQLVCLALCGQLARYPDFAGVLLEPVLRERDRLLAALAG